MNEEKEETLDLEEEKEEKEVAKEVSEVKVETKAPSIPSMEKQENKADNNQNKEQVSPKIDNNETNAVKKNEPEHEQKTLSTQRKVVIAILSVLLVADLIILALYLIGFDKVFTFIK